MGIKKSCKVKEVAVTQSYPNHYTWWKMNGRETLWGQGIIMVLDDEGSTYYFREAFEKKYNIQLDDSYMEIIENKLYEVRGKLWRGLV